MPAKTVGVPKEIKVEEYRVGLTPGAAAAYVAAGLRVVIETNAGKGSGFPDADYQAVGAEILAKAKDVYDTADMIIKVKEPLPCEYDLIRKGQLIYTFFHFAASETLTKAMIKSQATCVSYETIKLSDGSLPILVPMSEIAGKLAAQVGAQYLQKNNGGGGVLMGGAVGVERAKVLVLGCGISGKNAALVAAGMGADVTIADINIPRLHAAADVLPSNVRTLYSTDANITKELPNTDILIGAVLIPGAKAPQLIKRHHLRLMKPGSVLIDIAVDQGGCIETCHATTHSQPVFIEENVIHYCVANMPGVVPNTSTKALGHTTLKYGLELATNGLAKACKAYPEVLEGVDIANGKVYQPAVAMEFKLPLSNRNEIFQMN